MNRAAWRVFSFTLCLALTTLPAVAQSTAAQTKAEPAKPAAEPPKSEWFSIAVVRVKPEMVTEWQDLQKSVVNPALKKAGLKERGVFETAVFGEAYEYVIITPIASFAQYDEPMSPLRKTLGEDAWRDYTTKVRRCVASSHTYGAQTRPDLSYAGKMASMTGPPKLVVVTSISVVPGRGAAFEKLVKAEVLPVMKKVDVLGYFVSQDVFGGDAYGYTAVVFYDSFADIGKGSPFVRALGPEGAATFAAKFAGVIAHQERVVARFNTDLSFSAAP